MGENNREMRILVVLPLLVCCAHAIPKEWNMEDGAAMLSLLQMDSAPSEDATSYTDEEFAGLMNKIIMKASEMRVVMNKLGISDTDSVKSLEDHFTKLGEAHKDLGEGVLDKEELRSRGLQARECVKHAFSCSKEAATCPQPSQCKQVMEGCTRAASACGVGQLEKHAEKKEHEPEVKDAVTKVKPAVAVKKVKALTDQSKSLDERLSLLQSALADELEEMDA